MRMKKTIGFYRYMNDDTIGDLIDKLKKIQSTKLIVCIFNGIPFDKSKTLKFYGIKRHSYIEYSEKYKGGK